MLWYGLKASLTKMWELLEGKTSRYQWVLAPNLPNMSLNIPNNLCRSQFFECKTRIINCTNLAKFHEDWWVNQVWNIFCYSLITRTWKMFSTILKLRKKAVLIMHAIWWAAIGLGLSPFLFNTTNWSKLIIIKACKNVCEVSGREYTTQSYNCLFSPSSGSNPWLCH